MDKSQQESHTRLLSEYLVWKTHLQLNIFEGIVSLTLKSKYTWQCTPAHSKGLSCPLSKGSEGSLWGEEMKNEVPCTPFHIMIF